MGWKYSRPVLDDVMERPEPTPAMVEHPVEDDLHAPGVGAVEQLPQGRLSAEQRIDREVVVGMVAVVGGGGEDRCEVERVDAKLNQLIETVGQADQVAALEAMGGGRRAPRLQRPGLGHGRTSGEAIWKDLVEHGVLHPAGCINGHLGTLHAAT